MPTQQQQEYREDTRGDAELLRRYVETGSEEAFASLGRRYAGLVYAACLREIGETGLAEDAAQAVFLLLSQKARSLRGRESLAGWLYTASRYVARNIKKQERRRKMVEAEALNKTLSQGENRNLLWEQIEPHFDDALHSLKSADREVILLRFVQQQSLGEVGASLGISENTARMRVGRAIEKIRTHLGKAGIAVTVVMLAALLEAPPAHAVPVRLLQALPKIAATGAGGGSSLPLARLARQAGRRMALRPALLAGGWVVGVLLLGGAAQHYRRQALPRLSQTAQRRLFTSLAGTWQGTLEYADDRTGQHFTYPTTVIAASNAPGDSVQFTATYQGTGAVDVTTIAREGATGQFAVGNGGAQSSHRLMGVGEMARLTDGTAVFVGYDPARHVETRLSFGLAGNRLTLQEEYRPPSNQDGANADFLRNAASGSAYRFRNRFVLARQ